MPYMVSMVPFMLTTTDPAADVITALTAGVQQAVNSGIAAVTAIIPVGVAVMAVFTAIGMGKAAFKSFGGKTGSRS